MIFADPPYFLSNWWFTVQSGKRVSVKKWDWDISTWAEWDFQFHVQWIEEAKRILKENGTIWISWTYHSIYQCGYALQLLGFHILNDISWFKPNASPNLSCRFFTASHETIIWARKSKKWKHYFDYQSMKMGNWNQDFIKKPWLQMRSVWSIYPPKKQEKVYWKHPTQKPEELLRRIILASTKENDIILDPFSWSGTTGVVANRLRRNYIGIEKDKKFLDISIRRIEWP
jgi:site-specific DNA-methyltransferase (adenine-specific)